MSVIHWCQNEHKAIIYADEDFPTCPLCAARDDVNAATENEAAMKKTYVELQAELAKCQAQVTKLKKEMENAEN